MKLQRILTGTFQGFPTPKRAASNAAPEKEPAPEAQKKSGRPASGIHRLLAATQQGLGLAVAKPRVEKAKQTKTVAVGTPTAQAPAPAARTAPAAEPAPAGVAVPISAAKSALESIKVAFATGLYKTKAGVVGQKLLNENRPALHTYLTVQLRGGKAATEALAALEDMLEQGSADQLKKGPSQRAALFLAAKNHVEYERLFSDLTPPPLSAVPWQPTPPGRMEGWGRALDEMRFGLGESEAELLLLSQVAGLNAAELGYVLGFDAEDAARKLEAGAGFARLLLEDVFEEDELPDLAEVLKDAFRIEAPSAAELELALRPKVVQLPAGTLLGDRYEIEATLGGGEFAHVYRARDVRVPGHVVALKLLHRVARTEAAREGAMRELSLIASAFHPSLVQFKDHGWFEDRLWFVMPFYEGEMLLDRIERGPLDLDDALEHFERLARGLAALHAAGIRHQDVKPENIFLVEMRNETLPVLLDLGVASPNGEMALAGTPMYFPPEVAGRIFDEHCELPLTPKADVFALALSLLHSIEEPDLSDLAGVEVEDFLKKRRHLPPSGPRSKALSFLKPSFRRWLAKDPSERPSAMDLADELAEIRRGRGGGKRRSFSAPRGLRGALVALAMSGVLMTTAPRRRHAAAPRRDRGRRRRRPRAARGGRRRPDERERRRPPDPRSPRDRRAARPRARRGADANAAPRPRPRGRLTPQPRQRSQYQPMTSRAASLSS